MLAASCDDLDALKYPLLATQKIDGIRCLIINGIAMSRSLKPIPNRYIQSILGNPALNGFDGELLVGDSFQQATSGIMSEDGVPDFRYYVFDVWDTPSGYRFRVTDLVGRIGRASDALRHHAFRLHTLFPVRIATRAELDAYLAEMLAEGHEGVMVRSPDGPYKQGRATFKEGYLTKVKPFEDAEAIIVGFEERMHNANEATTNALGHTERSSHKENLIPMNTLGALIVKNDKLWPGKTFNIGTGFTDAQRAEIWRHHTDWGSPSCLLNCVVKFKYQAIGTKDVPRIPVFLGFRDARDL